MTTAGHIRQRSAQSWELKFSARDSATGQRVTRYATVKGGRREAQARLAELIAAANSGADVKPAKRLTVAEHVAERIDIWRKGGKISAKTAERRGELARNQIARIGGIKLQTLTSIDVERWHVGMLADGLSPRTIRDAHHVLRAALDQAEKHHLVPRNVARLQKPPPVPHEEVEILDADQVDPMLAKLADHPLRVAVVTALYTGVRRGEQLALRWSDIDLDARTLRVERALEETRAGIVVKRPKTPSSVRDVSLPGVVVDALRDHRRQQLELRLALGMGKPDGDALVFPGADFGFQSPRNYTTTWSRVVKRLELPQIGWHALRHTHASMLIDAKVDIATIAKRLGHRSASTTLSTYSHLYKSTDRAAADAIDALAR